MNEKLGERSVKSVQSIIAASKIVMIHSHNM